jgi:hypothetical protein
VLPSTSARRHATKHVKCPTHARKLVRKPAKRLLVKRARASKHVIKALAKNLATRLLVIRTRLVKNLVTMKRSARRLAKRHVTKPAISSNSYLYNI